MIEYAWSLFLTVSSPKQTNLKREQMIDWFEDLENFMYFQNKQQSLDIIRDLI